MSTVVSHPAVVATGNKFLWGAIGALSVSTLALGAVVLHQHTQTAAAEAPIEVLAISTPAAATPVVKAPPSVVAPDTASNSVHAEKKQSKPTSAQDNQAPRATKVIAQQPAAKAPATPVVAPAPAEPPVATAQAPAQAPAKVPAKVVCTQCGVIEGVTPIQRESANPSGAGAVAGAVLGGLVGNQFGGGDGKALATIAGVLGGGWLFCAVPTPWPRRRGLRAIRPTRTVHLQTQSLPVPVRPPVRWPPECPGRSANPAGRNL